MANTRPRLSSSPALCVASSVGMTTARTSFKTAVAIGKRVVCQDEIHRKQGFATGSRGVRRLLLVNLVFHHAPRILHCSLPVPAFRLLSNRSQPFCLGGRDLFVLRGLIDMILHLVQLVRELAIADVVQRFCDLVTLRADFAVPTSSNEDTAQKESDYNSIQFNTPRSVRLRSCSTTQRR